MERITSISQLSKGDRIVKISGEVVTMLQYHDVHPNDLRLEEEKWYKYVGSTENWIEIYQMMVDNLQKDIDYYKREIKELGGECKDNTIEKACEWLASNVHCDGYTLQSKAKLIRDFKKAMED